MYIVPIPRSAATHPLEDALTALGWTFVTELREEHPGEDHGHWRVQASPPSFTAWYRAPDRDTFAVLTRDDEPRLHLRTALLNSAIVSTEKDEGFGDMFAEPWPEGGVYDDAVEADDLPAFLAAHGDAVAQAVAAEGAAPIVLDGVDDVVIVWRLLNYRAACHGAAGVLGKRAIPKPGKPLTPDQTRWRALAARVPLPQLAALPGAPTPDPDGFGLWAVEVPFTPA
jgi:hypothetical protein